MRATPFRKAVASLGGFGYLIVYKGETDVTLNLSTVNFGPYDKEKIG